MNKYLKNKYILVTTGYVCLFLIVSLLNNYVPIDKQGLIYLPKGKSVNSIYKQLEHEKYIYDKLAFRVAVFLTRTNLKAGEYKIQKNDTAFDILNKINNNKVHFRKLTIPEGLSNQQVLEIINANNYMHGKLSIDDGTVLLAETYYFERGSNRTDFTDRMQKQFYKKANLLWNNHAVNLPFKNIYQAVILASIVEKETGLDSERKVIASVFINRLNKGMKLQSDPTVIYAVTNGYGKMNRYLTKKDLRIKNSHNTYYTKGLPPTPISGVGMASLNAVLHPEKTKYYYFVADGKGGHNFAKTLAEHNKNIYNYRKNKK